ncbi:LysR family transcriptional regulator [Amphibacillus cookii]|uniref:LysR family transcriptional regulator n=1 Tax=Amphibacillus cookii TaxID=767787 RepID=UPI00195676E5|nr:LysR family transcriptional regulator [Amphibacillus cookii]MBM7542584.1 DNA-binding transcriptional LysR family regulator [Amphibacillus cookii]
MNIKQLQYFIAVAENGTISAAAKKLGISQPPLSVQLKQLEDSLHVQLFERGARKVNLTEAGKILYKRANSIVALSRMTIHELDHFQKNQSGTLRLGTISSVGASLYHDRLQAFNRIYPDLTYDIHEGNTYELLEKLSQDEIDLAIVRTPFQADDVICHSLKEEPMLAVTTDHYLTDQHQGKIAIDQLKDQPLIYYRRMEHVITAAFQKHGLEPVIKCLNDDARTSMMWAEAGLGVALVPESIAKLYWSNHITSYQINEPDLFTQVTAIRRKAASCSPIVLSFLDLFNV